jgi:uncharacterized protein (DUF2267 family)
MTAEGMVSNQWRHDMDYHEMIRRVRKLDFIRNDETADAAVKAVLGILACALTEEQARKLSEKFPEQLALNRSGSGDRSMQPVSVKEYTAGICAEYKISVHQARTLVRNVLYFTKIASGDNFILDIRQKLPVDWAEAIQNA